MFSLQNASNHLCDGSVFDKTITGNSRSYAAIHPKYFAPVSVHVHVLVKHIHLPSAFNIFQCWYSFGYVNYLHKVLSFCFVGLPYLLVCAIFDQLQNLVHGEHDCNLPKNNHTLLSSINVFVQMKLVRYVFVTIFCLHPQHGPKALCFWGCLSIDTYPLQILLYL